MDHSFGAVVYTERAGKRLYLLVLHTSPGHWGIPKGHPKGAETPEATIYREIREETGCPIRLLPDYEDSITYALPRGEMKEVRFRLAELVEPGAQPLPNDEIRALGWFTADEAARTITYENSREVLVRADAYLERREGRSP